MKTILETMPAANYKSMKALYLVLQKRNIYSSIRFVEMQSVTETLDPLADTDALFIIEPRHAFSQWYYTSFKTGKRIFAYDRTSPTPLGRVHSFLDAVQEQARRD